MQMSRLWGLLTRTEVTVPTVLKSVTTFFIVFSFQNDVLTPQIFTDEHLFFIIGLLKVVLIMSTLNLLKKYKFSCITFAAIKLRALVIVEVLGIQP